MANTVQIVFQPSGRRGEIEAGKSILEAARTLGVGIEAACGGARVCGKCRVIVETGRFEKLNLASAADHVSPVGDVERKFLTVEELARGYRLACNAFLSGDLVVTVPEESRSAKQVILEKGRERKIEVRPAVKNITVTLPAASLSDFRDDRQRLRFAGACDALRCARDDRFRFDSRINGRRAVHHRNDERQHPRDGQRGIESSER